jgi:hypothetical protein
MREGRGLLSYKFFLAVFAKSHLFLVREVSDCSWRTVYREAFWLSSLDRQEGKRSFAH